MATIQPNQTIKDTWYCGFCKHGYMIMASEDFPDAEMRAGVVHIETQPLSLIRRSLEVCPFCKKD